MNFPDPHWMANKRHSVTPASCLKAAENLDCDVVTFFYVVRLACARVRARMGMQTASHRHISLYYSILLFKNNRLRA